MGLYSSQVLSDRPVAFWRLDDNGPPLPVVAHDATGYANNGALVGGVVPGLSGVLADGTSSMAFDGSSGVIQVPDAAVLRLVNTLTIEAWVYINSYSFTNPVVNKVGSPANAGPYDFWVGNDGTLWLSMGNGSTDFMSANSGNFGGPTGLVTTKAWHHIVATMKLNPGGATAAVAFYVDGQPAGSGNQGVSGPLVDAGGILRIGERNDASPYWFNGRIDEVAIYPYALSAATVLAHYKIGLAPVSKPPVAGRGWTSDGNGYRVYDGTSNDYGAPSGPGVTVELTPFGNAFFRGTITTSRLQGKAGGAAGRGARMWLDFTAGDPLMGPAGATAGVSPYWAVTDDNGVIRVEAGLLTALGISPTQWGLRVRDALNNPIFDSLGLIAVMKSLGSSAYNGTDQIIGATSATDVNGSGVSFYLNRPAAVIAFATISAYMVQNPPIASGNVVIDSGGFGSSPRVRFPFINSGRPSVTQTCYLFVPNVPAGSNTWDLKSYVDTSPDTIDINDWHLNVFLLGS